MSIEMSFIATFYNLSEVELEFCVNSEGIMILNYKGVVESLMTYVGR